MLLPLALWRSGPLTATHWLGAVFLAYAILSVSWCIQPWDGIWAVWELVLAALAFWLGSTLVSLRLVLLGMAIGLWISSAAAISQFFGDYTFLIAGLEPGLFYNPMIAGEYATLVILGLIVYREWWYIPGITPLLVLSHSRGAWIALGFGLIAHYGRSLWLLAGTAIGAFAAVLLVGSPDDTLRLQIWQAAITNLHPFGWGAGSFLSVFLPPIHPEYTHNDFLQLAFEYGIGAFPILLGLSCLAIRPNPKDWPILATFLFMGCFSFPLYAPVTTFLGALCAGRLATDWADDRSLGYGWRSLQLSWRNPSLP